jgi:hypothetical protein
MKNKDKYDLRDISIAQRFKYNGCGKQIPETRELVISCKGMEIHHKITQEPIIIHLMK